MSNWLAKQKKIDLNDLAIRAGFDGSAGLKKDDLVTSLDKFIQTNASRLANVTAFDEYFAENKPKARPQRRTTRAPADFDAETSPEPAVSSALATRTPRTQKVASRVPLPASPAAVTDLVERQATRLTNTVKHYWDATGITDYAEAARESLSTVAGIQVLLLAFEAYGLQRATLPWRYAFSLPGLSAKNPLALSFPDLFVLLTSDFWGPTSLWLATSIVVPLTVAWFFNLTVHSKRSARYAVDPLVFSVVKGVTAWLVYGPPAFVAAGYVAKASALRVNLAIPGGWYGIVIGSLIGMVASLYEVALRK